MSRENKIVHALEDMLSCCQRMKEYGRCNSDDCPMSGLCLEDTSFLEVADLLYSERVKEFIEAAENATPDYSKWDYEADKWNDRRNDPGEKERTEWASQ